MIKKEVVIFWFRRDLRLEDNSGLNYALQTGAPVLPIFIYDENILNELENKTDRRVHYFQQALAGINKTLQSHDARLATFYGKPLPIFQKLTEQYSIRAVFCNRDYEPYALDRDTEIYKYFANQNIPFRAFKDQVIFDKNEIVKKDGTPYTVYSPYANRWRENLAAKNFKPSSALFKNFFKEADSHFLSLKDIGFKTTDIKFEKPELAADIINAYNEQRNYPSVQGTTQLSTALRFGTISIRKCVAFAQEHSQTWLSELIWREFFMQILYHFPKVVHHSFKAKYDAILWRNNESEFEQWCAGKTGYPIVDAGMRQLNATGFMHNRVRMITASFLCKHLLIDWRWGEAYFAEKLNDYDLAANNGNWQWAAGCGCDAAPYFRIFNPEVQTQKFDKNHTYIKAWVPEFETKKYPQPMVDHAIARERALRVYGAALKENG